MASQRPRAFQILVTRMRFGARGCTKQRPIRRVLSRAYVHTGCERWSGGALGWRPRGQGGSPFSCRHVRNTGCKEECKKCTVFPERRWQTLQFFLKDIAKDMRKTLVFLERRSILNKRIDNIFLNTNRNVFQEKPTSFARLSQRLSGKTVVSANVFQEKLCIFLHSAEESMFLT